MAETLEDKLAKIERGEKEVLNKFQQSIPPGGDIHTSDFLLIGAAKRTVAFGSAFRTLIRARNFTAASPYVRMQLDTAMRMYAGYLVADPEAYAAAVLEGQAINKMKDRDGKQLMDSYLAKKLSEVHPWVEPVYKETCELVHFTSRHIHASTMKTDDATRTVYFQISAEDPARPESDYFEVVDGFYQAMRVTGLVCLGWQEAKRMRRQARAAADAAAAPPPA